MKRLLTLSLLLLFSLNSWAELYEDCKVRAHGTNTVEDWNTSIRQCASIKSAKKRLRKSISKCKGFMKGGLFAEFTGLFCDLSELDLSGIDLSHTIIRPDGSTRFDNIFFKKTDLSNAYLVGFSGGIQTKIDMSEANLLQADLRRVDLISVNLEKANLSQANLKQAKLMKANLQEAILVNANLENANFKFANLRHAILINSTAKHADFTGADLQGADLSFADFSAAFLAGTNLDGVKYCGTLMPWGELNDDC
jgi:uncharacterized protein YjbI with pentapeptide repeats